LACRAGPSKGTAILPLITEHRIAPIARALALVKADAKTPALQQEFFDRVLK
jgi:hypothetical protein